MKNWLITLLTTLLICNTDFWADKPFALGIGVFVVVAAVVWELDLQIGRMKWREKRCEKWVTH